MMVCLVAACCSVAAMTGMTATSHAHQSTAPALQVAPATITPDGPTPASTLTLQLHRRAFVDVTIYSGSSVVRRLHRGALPAGRHAMMWDGTGVDGTHAASGAYIARVAISYANAGARQVRRARIAVAAPAGSTSAPTATLAWPLDSPVTSPFGQRGTRQHQGIDISALAGTPSRAAAAGTVIQAGSQQGYGLTIVIRHPSGHSTLYAHQSRLAAAAQQPIKAGQIVGYVGRTGDADGDHLHFEVRDPAGTPLDPLLSLPVR